MSDVIVNDKDLLDRLIRVGDKLPQVYRESVRTRSEPLVEEMRRRIHNVSGDLAKSIARQMRRGERGIWEAARVGPTWPRGAHGYLVEFGHALVKGGKVIGNVPAHPYVRPAAEACEAEFIEGVTADIKKAVEAVL